MHIVKRRYRCRSAFNTVNLFFKYSVPAESGIWRDLESTVNGDHVFNEDPAVFFGTGPNDSGYANGFTFGRMLIFGVKKKF